MAGAIVLRTIAGWMIDGRDPAKTREFIRWLSPTDVIYTEHRFILRALQTMERENDELSLDRLRAMLYPEDVSGFLRIALEGIVEDRDAGARDDAEFGRLMAILESLRAGREQESLKVRRDAVIVARMILDRSMGMTEGANHLARSTLGLEGEERFLVSGFHSLADNARDFPMGPIRTHWAAEALMRKDRERMQFENDARPEIETACRTLIDRWGNA